MTKIRMRFTGTFTSHGEIAISLPGAAKSSRMIDMAPKKMLHNTERHYIPASSIRGFYRAAMHKFLCQSINEARLPKLDYRQHARNAVGGVKGNETGTPSPRAILDLLDQNPIIDAFGGGEPVFAEGRMKIYDATSKEVASKITKDGVRADPFRRNPELATDEHMSNPENYMRIAELNAELRPWTDAKRKLDAPKIKSNDEAISKIIDELSVKVGVPKLTKALIDAKIDELTVARQALGGSSNTLLRPLPSVSMIPQGEFDHRIEVINANDHTIGMFIEALRMQADEKFAFGGLTSKGNGFVTASYAVQVLVDSEWVNDCTIVLNDTQRTFEVKDKASGCVVEKCRAAYAKALKGKKLDFTFAAMDGQVVLDSGDAADEDDNND